MDSQFYIPLLIGLALGAVLAPLLARMGALRIISILFLGYMGFEHYGESISSHIDVLIKDESSSKRIVKLTSGNYLIEADELNIRIAPNRSGRVVAKLTRGDSVFVYETVGAYARISDYFDGSGYQKSGNVAQWVSADFLSAKEPSDIK